MKVLVTGAAGFIGFHTSRALLERGDEVVGLDNLNKYYDIGLKHARLDLLKGASRFRFVRLHLADRKRMAELFAVEKFQRAVHLGVQRPVDLTRYVEVLEECLGRKARKNLLPMQPGDVPATWGDVTELEVDFDCRPTTSVEEGVKRFVEWYLEFHEVGS